MAAAQWEWKTHTSNTTGVDEMLNWCEKNGWEIFSVVATPDKVSQFVIVCRKRKP